MLQDARDIDVCLTKKGKILSTKVAQDVFGNLVLSNPHDVKGIAKEYGFDDELSVKLLLGHIIDYLES